MRGYLLDIASVDTVKQVPEHDSSVSLGPSGCTSLLHSLEVRLKLGRRNPSISPGAPEAK